MNLIAGKKHISLLSATVGLGNYGEHFDDWPAGTVNGPVKLVAADNTIINLTSNAWSYKVGMQRERKKFYSSKSNQKWNSDRLVKDTPLTWYKATFEAPQGEDALVLDLQGMGKGEGWVNGHSIGRYWLTFMAPQDACQPCDYRVPYATFKLPHQL
ncbi:putative beta-galactosidase [Dioscorea sansibarensis]